MGTSWDSTKAGCRPVCKELLGWGHPPLYLNSHQRTVALLPGEVKPGWFWARGRGLPEGEVVGAWLPAPHASNPKARDCKDPLWVTE